MNNTRPARRLNTPSPLDTIVLNHHQSMTAPQMSEKFGYHVSSFHKAARRVGVELVVRKGRRSATGIQMPNLTASEAVRKYHAEMTVYEMRDKFGFNVRHLVTTATKRGLKIKPKKPEHAKSEKPAKVVTPRVKVVKPEPKKVPPVMKNKPMPAAKPRKESNSKNPERFKVKKVSYEGMRMLPVGIDNQYFYVAQEATEEEIAQERARRRERIEVKKQRERLTAL